jgi:hypothetical protein
MAGFQLITEARRRNARQDAKSTRRAALLAADSEQQAQRTGTNP